MKGRAANQPRRQGPRPLEERIEPWSPGRSHGGGVRSSSVELAVVGPQLSNPLLSGRRAARHEHPAGPRRSQAARRRGPGGPFLRPGSCSLAYVGEGRRRPVSGSVRAAPSFPVGPYSEAWLVCGRRAGISFLLALIAVYLAALSHLGPVERATTMVVVANRKQAHVIMRYVKGLLAIETHISLVENETAESVDLSDRVTIEVGTAGVPVPSRLPPSPPPSRRHALRSVLMLRTDYPYSGFFDRVAAEPWPRTWDEMQDKQADPARSKDRIHPQAVARMVSDLAKRDAVFVIEMVGQLDPPKRPAADHRLLQ